MSNKYYFITYETRGIKSCSMPMAGKQIISDVINIHPFEFINSLPILSNYYAPDEFDEVEHTLLSFQEITEEDSEIWRRAKDGKTSID